MNNTAETTDQLDPDQLAPALVTVPARVVLAVDGAGAPEDSPFAAAVRALFAVRAALGAGEDVALEGSYAQDGDPLRFDLDAPAGWHWRLLVPAPTGADAAAVGAATARFGAPVHLRAVRPLLVAQLLHRGRYVDEAPSLAALAAFVVEQGRTPVGPHTEVYLTDPGSTAPAELRTLLRMPVR
jgi:hypothetical protein